MALKAKSSETNESSDDKDSKMKSYITRQFKKFMKNANVKGFDKDRKQSSSSQFKSQDRGKKDTKDGGQYTVPFGPKCFRCHGFGHMKQECPTYLKSIGKSKALIATLTNTKLETESDDNDDEGILSAFTATVNPTEGIIKAMDEEEDLVKSKFEKMDEQDDIHTAYAKLYKVFEKYKKLYRLATKVDEANQTIGALSLRTTSWLNELRSLKHNYSKFKLSWRGLPV